MRAGPAFTTSLTYIPLREIRDINREIEHLTVKVLAPVEDVNFEDEYTEAGGSTREEVVTLLCYDRSVAGYLGMPRAYAAKKYPHVRKLDFTVSAQKTPELFTSSIKPRDDAQADFWNDLKSVIEQPGPVDLVANATTGAGKTITALWLAQDVIQAPILVTVPNNYLRNQWRQRIVDTMGRKWADRYVGHIQQDIMDYEGRLITIGLAPSLSRRWYPLALRQAFTAIIFDEWHKVGAPRMSLMLQKYPARIRIGQTATNRKDALLKVCTLHLGSPRVKSKQKVMSPKVYIKKHDTTIPRGYPISSEFQVINFIAKKSSRNGMLAEMIHDFGWSRNRHVVGLSDRTDQLIDIRERLIDMGVPGINVGILCGEYKVPLFNEARGKVVRTKLKMSQEDKDYIASTCNIILTTWGQFDTGSDIDHLDMGVELTPRSNLRQGIGRILRILKGKPTPEWYGTEDRVMYYEEKGTRLFADPRPIVYARFLEMHEARMASYKFHNPLSIEYL